MNLSAGAPGVANGRSRQRVAAVMVLFMLVVLSAACGPAGQGAIVVTAPPANNPTIVAPSPQANSAAAAPATAPVTRHAPTTNYPHEITTAEAAAKRDAGAFILDVREPDEWTNYHVPGSTLIPLGELPSRVNEVPRDKEVVVVCRSGNRSASGRDILLAAGFQQATSLQGGLTRWKAEGYPTVSGQ
jgi:rhodanese-related sulfurtransferase